MSKDVNFINGIVKSREGALITPDKTSRLIECESVDEAIAILREYGFGKGVEIERPTDYDRMLKAESDALAEFLREYSPSEKLKRCFFARNDFHNAECAVRLHYGYGSEKMFLPQGEIPIPVLTVAIDEDFKDVPTYLSEPMKKSVIALEAGAAGGAVSLIFLRAYYAYMLSIVPRGAYRDAIRHEIDGINVATALRSISEEQAANSYISGGKITERQLGFLAARDTANATQAFAFTDFSKAVESGLKAKEEGKPLVFLEKELDEYFLRSLSSRRYETEGVLPILLYKAYKEIEIKNVRIILTGLIGRVNKDEIKARLREGYGR